ncbi:Conserved hypothetical protein [Prochlorococcus marinus str. MIT 9303]|uniref:Uncharacterized protein n=1 Tax=Prochlorococcus marinus (strain MIT 9303) TaxID=59922 RepID=A2C8M9_PROM3|nr:Conserved hypothetical protein [Prochlorococcus marinus str. MIT 9303]
MVRVVLLMMNGLDDWQNKMTSVTALIHPDPPALFCFC